jgi:mono/diheme cytochrome c family protein
LIHDKVRLAVRVILVGKGAPHMRIASLLCIALLAAVPVAAKPVGDAARGEALTRRWCAACHQPEGAAASDAAPTFTWIAGQEKKDPAYIRAFLNHPHAPMPPIDLDQAEIADIVAYFDDLSKR